MQQNESDTMSILSTSLQHQDPTCIQMADAMQSHIDGFRRIEAQVLQTEQNSADKFHKHHKLLPRERIALLLDRAAPFLELCSLAGYGMHDDTEGNSAGGGCIVGIGYVEGVRCMVTASNSAVKGGTISPAGLHKTLRAQKIALENKLPLIALMESGGANLNYQAEIFVEGARVFANQARLSAAGIPQITVVHGNSTAGGAYGPGLSDYVIMVRNQAKVFLAGPPLLKAATGEIATDEELGGAEMHATTAGTAEYLAEDDADGIRIARQIVKQLQWHRHVTMTHGESATHPIRPPLYPADDLLSLVPVDYRKPYDVREIIARIVDASEFLEFKALYDQQTICGHASIEGYPCGIIGNNGPITSRGAVKAAQFIQLCCQSGTPLLYLQNTTGYMVGTQAEQSGIVKHGSKMIQAVANATVPQITVHIGASFGAGNYGMCGRGLDPRFIFAWPNNRIGVMGGEQAARVMTMITEQKMARMGQQLDAEYAKSMEQHIITRMDQESQALYATARLWDDGIIDPRDTRWVIGFTLAICDEAQRRTLKPNSFGVARL